MSGYSPVECRNITEAKRIAEKEGFTLGQDCRYIQIKDGTCYLYEVGDENGESGPETYRFDPDPEWEPLGVWKTVLTTNGEDSKLIVVEETFYKNGADEGEEKVPDDEFDVKIRELEKYKQEHAEDEDFLGADHYKRRILELRRRQFISKKRKSKVLTARRAKEKILFKR